jgi:hypothetical protein
LAFPEILLLIIYLFAFTFALLKCSCFKIPGAKPSLIIALWGYKILAGVLFYLIFSLYIPYSHGSDSEVYFKDGINLAKVGKESPKEYFQLLTGAYSDESKFEKHTGKLEYWNRSYPSIVPNDNRIVIRTNSMFSFISFGFYSIHLLIMAFLSFVGLFLIYKAIAKFFTNVKRMLVLAVFIIPSTVFWSAGNLKEPILIFLLGVFIYNFIQISTEKSWKLIPLFLISTYLLVYTKPYVLFLLLPITLSFFVAELLKSKKVYWIYFSVFGVLGVLIAFISILFPEFSIAKLLTIKQLDFISMVSASHSGSTFEIPILQKTYWSLLIYSPMALINSLTRPWIWEPETWTQLVAALENMVIIIIAILLMIRFRFKKISHSNFALFALLFGLQSFILAGLITPNMGALVRYKSIGLPFLFIALLSGWSLTNSKGKDFFSKDIFKQFRKKIGNYFWEAEQKV